MNLKRFLLIFCLGLWMAQPSIHSSESLYSSTIKFIEDSYSKLPSWPSLAGITAATGLGAYVYYNYQTPQSPSLSDNWALIDGKDLTLESLNIPSNFLWGAATAAYQVEGGICNTWTHYQDPSIQEPHNAGICCNSWNQLDADIACLKELGVKCYRFSLEWARIQPTQDTWDTQALEKYVKFCKKLKACDIEPIITLHHYTDPVWFMGKEGFSNATNIKYFISYVEKVYTALADADITYIITFNQPIGYAQKSYYTQTAPPYEKGNNEKVQTTIANLFQAHIESYDVIKNIAYKHDKQKPLISISHQYTQFNASQSLYYPINVLITSIAYSRYNTPFELFFLYGQGAQYIDFVALSYYCSMRFELTNSQAYTAQELCNKADKDFRIIDAQGFYNALLWAQQFEKPILVVENGIETDSDSKRMLFLNRYLWTLSQALEQGCNIIGYCYWSLLDNFEWSHEFDYHFGLFSVNREHCDFLRTLKYSGLYYKKIIANNSL